MTWAGDKTEVLDKLDDLFHRIEKAPNRYQASLQLFQEFDFFISKLVDDDPTIFALINIDKEFINAYLTQMSELMGREK